jgi:transaldolase
MTRLHDLYEHEGQSPWLDNLRRDYLTGGHLTELVEQGIRGVTSNPTIFAKAISGEDDYDEQFRDLLVSHSVEDAYWELVLADIDQALRILRPVHEASGGIDGFVSVEVAPALAHDALGTEVAARQLHERIAQPNVFVKIPATSEGIDAVRTMIGEGRSINVTLIFGIERYEEVIEAYLAGLETYAARGASDLSPVRSVASFFISRVDTEVDRRIEALAGTAPDAESILALRGKAAVAQAQRAYAVFQERFSGPRWDALAAKGAKVQRPLWASTSTKNPAYPDLAYVDTLIGPNTVNTMPDQTLDAVLDHGTITRTVDTHLAAAEEVLAALGAAGIDFADVADTLENEGVASFAASFDELIESLTTKAATLRTGS